MHKSIISSIEAECKSKGIDIETAYVVRMYELEMTASIRDHIVDNIYPDVVTIIYDFDFRLVVCNAEVATYLKLTYGDYIAYTYTYKEWYEHRIRFEQLSSGC